MTIAEKFKAVFGIEFHEMDEYMLIKPYRKQKLYAYTLFDDPHGRCRKAIAIGYVHAGSLKEARKTAIDELGNKYKRYSGSEWPMYALKIEEVKEK